MHVFILAVMALVLGYLTYGKIVDHVFAPDDRPTPAMASNDGVDYVPMSRWKAFVIQLLNIAGTGPIFGAVMGAMWGPAVFLWIVFGSILGGAVHDYMSGMMSVRNNGSSITELVGKYLGKMVKILFLPFSILVLVLVAAVFTRSAADLFNTITGIDVSIWVGIIIVYFFASSILPIDKIIGRIYPIFGLLLTLMVVMLVIGVVVKGYPIPEFTFENEHPLGLPMWPYMFITVACGAISGFHSTQSPLMARCIRSEREGRWIFYGAMIAEGLIALCCAAAVLAYYGNGAGIYDAVNGFGVSGALNNMSMSLFGLVGGAFTIIGIAICPITSGDTALRSVRMMIMDMIGITSDHKRQMFVITLAVTALAFSLLFIDFSILWRYFSWANQTMATIVLWAATVYLVYNARKLYHVMITALPAMFMTAVTTSYILIAPEGFGIDQGIVAYLEIGIMLSISILFLAFLSRTRDGGGSRSDIS